MKTIIVLFMGLAISASSGCTLLDAAAEFSGKRVWDTCMLPQTNRAQIKAPVEAEAIQACTDDGQFTAAECASISLSFGCPQDVVVP